MKLEAWEANLCWNCSVKLYSRFVSLDSICCVSFSRIEYNSCLYSCCIFNSLSFNLSNSSILRFFISTLGISAYFESLSALAIWASTCVKIYKLCVLCSAINSWRRVCASCSNRFWLFCLEFLFSSWSSRLIVWISCSTSIFNRFDSSVMESYIFRRDFGIKSSFTWLRVCSTASSTTETSLSFKL